MQTVLVISFCVAMAYGGVVPWTRERELEAHRQFQQYCFGQSDNGESGGISWHCKKAPFVIRDSKKHTHRLNVQGSDKEQVVFIETPAKETQHEVQVTGNLNTNSRTKVFVVPAVDRQSVSVTDDVSVNSQHAKPSIFFLKDSPRGSSSRDSDFSRSSDSDSHFQQF